MHIPSFYCRYHDYVESCIILIFLHRLLLNMKNFSIKTSFEQIRDFWSLQDKTIQPSQAVTELYKKLRPYYKISIHTTLAGCDFPINCRDCGRCRFQSTQPSQAVTRTTMRSGDMTVTFQSTQPSQAVTAIMLNKNLIPTNIITYNS